MSIQDAMQTRLTDLNEQIEHWTQERKRLNNQIEHVERVLLELLELKREVAQRLARMERAAK